MNKKLSLVSVLFFVFILAMVAVGCSNILLKKDSNFSVSFFTPIIDKASSDGSRSATGTDWKINGWLELEDGTILQSQQTTAGAEEAISIAFSEVYLQSNLWIKIDCVSATDKTIKYSASSQLTVLEGENVVNLTLDRAMVPAARPQISTQPKDINQFFDESSQDDKKVELSVVASNTGDQEKLTYQWYSNTIKSTVGAEAVENGNVDTVEITISPNDTKYFYCVVTSTIEDNQYVIPTSVTSDIVKVAYLQQPQRTLEKIIADFNKTYMLLDSFDYTDFSVTEYYDDKTTTMVKSLDGSYIVTIPERSIGKVPVTITNSSKPEITTTIEIPVKYQLDASNLSISGDSSVEQNKDLKLTAEYKVDGKDSYNLYTSASSSSSYKIIENVNISWQGATKQQNAWEAMAETSNAGTGKTATVTLTPKDEWCVTTGGVEKSHSYEVTKPATSYGLSWDSSTKTLTIYNGQGLKNFRDIVNGTLTQSIEVDGKTFSGTDRSISATLANDIKLDGEWTPIGKSGAPYTGTFDGAGYTVSGISITSGTDKGFFGYIQNGSTIKNLTVAGSIVASSNSGGIVAYSKGGTIQYCVNKVQVTSTSDYVGGIVGYVYQGTPSITGCVNLAQITGNNYVGGIIGHSSSNYAATIDKCINLGSVNSSNTNLSYVGGIQGYSTASSNKITNSLNLGTINNSKGNGAGIICNGASLTIQYCLSAGTISASSKYAVASSSGTYTGNYYDSNKITNATTTGGTGKATSALKVANAWDTSWTTTNWSFAAGRYPVPNIQDNIPSDIWKDIVEKAQQ